MPLQDFLNKIRVASTKNILYTIHALDEMNAEDELISKDEVGEIQDIIRSLEQHIDKLKVA